jgi:hypothetical protein
MYNANLVSQKLDRFYNSISEIVNWGVDYVYK